ncbi:MAG: CinA family protein [Bacteroides sp.]|nr:CinA family protein [Eubacterium sp.]MCM1418692.1 CinA family protein [Roseburia sp.]MCM1462720.1 CinA family protein [Bacteroides sp.]
MVTKLDKKAQNVVQYLRAKGQTLATAESCTGGLVSGAVTAVPGASEVFGYGACTYANEAKVKLLSVKPTTLAAHGAVSEETAVEMAEGIRALSGADYGVSTTGIAGPGGGTDKKPVGTVWIGISSERRAFAVKNVFTGDTFPDEGDRREAIRKEAVLTALSLLERELLADE